MPDKQIQNGFSRYIPVSADARRWGICVTDLGYTKIPVDSDYPPNGHPAQYAFNWESGRVLHEYQIVYISRGKGAFWSERSGSHRISAGSVFLLFPGVRHRYRPHLKTGWDEHWIGFIGNQGAQLMGEFFSPDKPVIKAGVNMDLQNLFMDACNLVESESFGFRSVIAAKTMELMARVHALSRGEVVRRPANEHLIRESCSLLSNQLPMNFDFQSYAEANGMSYSSFRRLFKEFTGLAPSQYLLDLKIRKACTLLTNTTQQVQEIAEVCSFDNQFYFSRIFKRHTGLSPLAYRSGGGGGGG